MFDIAWTEILVVAVIAILVVGPKELPAMLRAFGKTFGQVRRTAREFQNTFNDALREAERQAGLDDVKKNIDDVAKIDPTKDLRKTLSDTKKALGDKVGDAKFPHPDIVPLNGGGKDAAKADAPATKPDEAAPAAAQPDAASEPPKPPQAEGPADDATTPRAAAGAERR